MEEFSKSLITIHRTLMLATIAILAFALSDDPAGEYRDALHAERYSGSASHLFFYVLRVVSMAARIEAAITKRKEPNMSDDFQIIAKNTNAPFTLKLHRGDGMTLLAMNWKAAKPPRDFVGFALEYKEPDGDRFWTIKNRINFPNPDGSVNKARASSRLSPIQLFAGFISP